MKLVSIATPAPLPGPLSPELRRFSGAPIRKEGLSKEALPRSFVNPGAVKAGFKVGARKPPYSGLTLNVNGWQLDPGGLSKKNLRGPLGSMTPPVASNTPVRLEKSGANSTINGDNSAGGVS